MSAEKLRSSSGGAHISSQLSMNYRPILRLSTRVTWTGSAGIESSQPSPRIFTSNSIITKNFRPSSRFIHTPLVDMPCISLVIVPKSGWIRLAQKSTSTRLCRLLSIIDAYSRYCFSSGDSMLSLSYMRIQLNSWLLINRPTM